MSTTTFPDDEILDEWGFPVHHAQHDEQQRHSGLVLQGDEEMLNGVVATQNEEEGKSSLGEEEETHNDYQMLVMHEEDDENVEHVLNVGYQQMFTGISEEEEDNNNNQNEQSADMAVVEQLLSRLECEYDTVVAMSSHHKVHTRNNPSSTSTTNDLYELALDDVEKRIECLEDFFERALLRIQQQQLRPNKLQVTFDEQHIADILIAARSMSVPESWKTGI